MADHSFEVTGCEQENFYLPLCMSGYLTPLQRKKLREKRNFDVSEYQEIEVRNVKRRKKSLENKRRKPLILVKQKEKVKVPHLRCSVSKIIHKVADRNLKDNKFFKTCSTNRLENVIFTLPFSEKTNFCVKNESSVKEVHSSLKKVPLSEENSIRNEPVLRPNRPLETVNLTENIVNNTDTMDNQHAQIERVSETSLSERSIFDFEFPPDEELLKRQEKARSIARKKIRESHLLEEHNKCENSCESKSEDPKQKLYPIFYISKKRDCSQNPKSCSKSVTKCKWDSSSEQMILDAGQKDIGFKICDACGMIYTIGLKEDEKLHLDYHNKYLANLKFTSWKEEHVIGEYQDGKVLMVRKDDKSLMLKKIAHLLEIANRDLGFPDAELPTKLDVTFILFVLNDKRIVGCVVAERISSACPVMTLDGTSSPNCQSENVHRIGNWYASTVSVPAVCGINRIWVAQDYRRKSVASRMVDCLRCHFIHGHLLAVNELAFTDPTPDGAEFASSYTKSTHFLVYK